MFKREHHVRIATVLQALDAEILFHLGCYFGGGTAIVLAHEEYRESLDMDFLVSSREGFRELRQGLSGEKGIAAIFKARSSLNLASEIRSDQYGIRTLLAIGDIQIKFEVVLEARINLEVPTSADRICGVATLTRLDMATSKILANSDRWSDSSVFSRDLIDLAMLQLAPLDFKKAMQKANAAYGEAAERDLKKAIERLKNRPGRLGECMEALKMNGIPEAVVWSRIRSLR